MKAISEAVNRLVLYIHHHYLVALRMALLSSFHTHEAEDGNTIGPVTSFRFSRPHNFSTSVKANGNAVPGPRLHRFHSVHMVECTSAPDSPGDQVVGHNNRVIAISKVYMIVMMCYNVEFTQYVLRSSCSFTDG